MAEDERYMDVFTACFGKAYPPALISYNVRALASA